MNFLDGYPVAANEVHTEFLFSYGTLQLEPVQMATFGRQLAGTSDALRGFVLVSLKIEDPTFVALSGKAHHTMAKFTGRASDVISGMVLAITPMKFRMPTSTKSRRSNEWRSLQSGLRAGYVDARYAPSDS